MKSTFAPDSRPRVAAILDGLVHQDPPVREDVGVHQVGLRRLAELFSLKRLREDVLLPQDQAEATGPFSWKNCLRAKVDRWIVGWEFDFFAGSHDGYNRLPSAVISVPLVSARSLMIFPISFCMAFGS